MASSKFRVGKPANKLQRESLHLKHKKEKAAKKRELQFRRKKEEGQDPYIKAQRQSKNVPVTIDHKRSWDDVDEKDEQNELGAAVEAGRLKRRRTSDGSVDREDNDDTDFEGLSGAEKEMEPLSNGMDDNEESEDSEENEEDEMDSMLDSDSEEDENDSDVSLQDDIKTPNRATSPSGSSVTADPKLAPEILLSKFPTLFESAKEPKILITTSLNSTLHYEGELLTTLFPNATYVRRNKHRFSHNYSIREIASFASSPSRGYTTLIVLNELQKRPSGLDIVHLPSGPMFHFSISNFVEGKKLPGHGKPTNHWPELILNNFVTPLGVLTAYLFRTLFPPQADIEGRQVVTLHNQRDYIFMRRHRYVFRDRRNTEKKIVGRDGKEMKGVEDIKVSTQELGPRLTLKLRRVDKGIQRASGQEWEWKAGSEKKRTRFQL
ncbi:RNA processing factor 1 [Viridothelium virens]|uniref:RNA processing factor 1 n=1 Tax=Viridothelium virens TaxID=1048519 RepID=A0A6A6HKD5_VIRVR|nr:RNA processing factor 1 [Viridothelium virens]